MSAKIYKKWKIQKKNQKFFIQTCKFSKNEDFTIAFYRLFLDLCESIRFAISQKLTFSCKAKSYYLAVIFSVVMLVWMTLRNNLLMLSYMPLNYLLEHIRGCFF